MVYGKFPSLILQSLPVGPDSTTVRDIQNWLRSCFESFAAAVLCQEELKAAEHPDDRPRVGSPRRNRAPSGVRAHQSGSRCDCHCPRAGLATFPTVRVAGKLMDEAALRRSQAIA